MTPMSMLRAALDPKTIVRCQHDLVDRQNGRRVSIRQAQEITADVASFGLLLDAVLLGQIQIPEEERTDS